MTREATERSAAGRAAHAMRAAAIRLALERAGEKVDPTQAYGCVDWFLYDVASPPREKDKEVPPGALAHDEARDGAALNH